MLVLNLPAFQNKNAQFMTVSMETDHMAKSQPRKNQSERTNQNRTNQIERTNQTTAPFNNYCYIYFLFLIKVISVYNFAITLLKLQFL